MWRSSWRIWFWVQKVGVNFPSLCTQTLNNTSKIKGPVIKIKKSQKRILFFFNQPPLGGWLITPKVCPEGVKRPRKGAGRKENEATILA